MSKNRRGKSHFLFLVSYFVLSTAFYPSTPEVGDSLKKAQQEKSAAIASQALQMCKDKQVR